MIALLYSAAIHLTKQGLKERPTLSVTIESFCWLNSPFRDFTYGWIYSTILIIEKEMDWVFDGEEWGLCPQPDLKHNYRESTFPTFDH